MSRLLVCVMFVSMGAYALSLGGCGTPSPAPAPQPPEPAAATAPAEDVAAQQPAQQEHAGHQQHAAHQQPSQYADALAQLSEADRALALKQKVCPVSGQPLGSMGTPYKVTVKGREVFLCCQGCLDAIQKEPDKYLAKLPQ